MSNMKNPRNWASLEKSLNNLQEFINNNENQDIWSRRHLLWKRMELLRKLKLLSKAAQIELERVTLFAEERWATHWRDDDTPQYERSFGTCKLVA